MDKRLPAGCAPQHAKVTAAKTLYFLFYQCFKSQIPYRGTFFVTMKNTDGALRHQNFTMRYSFFTADFRDPPAACAPRRA
jgi:hypothetical protein